jgi:hypothetical protein
VRVRDLFTAYLDASLRAKRSDVRLSNARQREDRERLRRDLDLLTKLIGAARHLSEDAITPVQIAARSERDRQRQSRIQATLASADRRIAALKTRRADGKPSGPMDTKKAQKEAERVRKLDQQATDIRASANSKASEIRSKIGR